MGKFKLGNIVRLKSGGPKMTVKGYKKTQSFFDIPEKESETDVECIYFDSGNNITKTFNEDLLDFLE